MCKTLASCCSRCSSSYRRVGGCLPVCRASLVPFMLNKFQTVIWKEGNVLFNDALDTFYLRSYGVGHMVKDDSDSERGNPLPSHGLLFPINSKGFLYAPSHRQDSTYHGLCYTSRGALVFG